jgi:hypothetical protein
MPMQLLSEVRFGRPRKLGLDQEQLAQRLVVEGKSVSDIGVLPTVVSSGAIWTEIEPDFHIEPVTQQHKEALSS